MEHVARFLIATIGGIPCLLMTCLLAVGGFLLAFFYVGFAYTVGVIAALLGGKEGREWADELARHPMETLRSTGQHITQIWEIWSRMASGRNTSRTAI